MSRVLDELVPDYFAEERLRLTLGDPLTPVRAFAPAEVLIDYGRTLPGGVVLPLEFTVSGPNPKSFERHYLRRIAPPSVTFTPREGGSFLVVVREVGHNRWFGRLRIDVRGDVPDIGTLVVL